MGGDIIPTPLFAAVVGPRDPGAKRACRTFAERKRFVVKIDANTFKFHFLNPQVRLYGYHQIRLVIRYGNIGKNRRLGRLLRKLSAEECDALDLELTKLRADRTLHQVLSFFRRQQMYLSGST